MKKQLTDRFLKSIKPPTHGRLEFYDQMVSGLTLRVTAQGVMTFALAYRLPGNSKKQKLTLGQYPTLSLADVRQKARAALAEIANGKDPAAARQAIKTAPTVADLLLDSMNGSYPLKRVEQKCGACWKKMYSQLGASARSMTSLAGM